MKKSHNRFSRVASLLCAIALVFSFCLMSACGNTDDNTTSSNQWYYGAEAPADTLGHEGDFYLNTQTLASYVKSDDGTWTETAANWYYGTKEPVANLGAENDFYLNTKTGELYQKNANDWGSPILTLKGEQGEPGRSGVVWFSGEDVPKVTDPKLKDAIVGDFYLETTHFDVYQKTSNTEWELLGSIKPSDGVQGPVGPQGDRGPQGEQGVQGEQGPQGLAGNLWYHGDVAPDEAGLTAKDGDFYMRTLPSYKKEGGGTYNGYKIYTYQEDGDGGWWKQVLDNSACTFLGVAHEFGADNICPNCGLENVFAGNEFHEDEGGNFTINGAPAGMKEVVVPHEIDGKTVKLAPGTFQDNEDLRSVVLEEGFTELTDPDPSGTLWGAFRGCTNLESVTLPSTLTKINRYSFYGCTSLKSIEIPASVTLIDDNAFKSSGLESVSLSEGLLTIDEEAFYCTKLKSVEIPDSVTTIGDWAFGNCYFLESVKFGDGAPSILDSGNKPGGAFRYCYNLLSVEFGTQMPTMADDTFLNCYRLVEVINPTGTEIVKGSETDHGGVAAHAIEIRTEGPSKITSDKDGYKFYTDTEGKKYLVDFDGTVGGDGTITLPEYEDEEYVINAYAFYYIANTDHKGDIKDVIFGNSVTEIGDYAFANLQLGTRYNFDFAIAGSQIKTSGTPTVMGKIKRIGAHAFEGSFKSAYFLTSLYIADTVESIGDEAFADCDALQNIYIGGAFRRDHTSSENSSKLNSLGKGIFKNSGGTLAHHFYFRNTTEKWKELVAGKEGEDNIFYNCSPSLIVHCNDGNLDVNGNEKN